MRRWLIAFLIVAGLAPAWALQVGRDYTLITPAQPTSNPAKLVVTEYFSYQCPHCYSFMPSLNAWVKKLPADVVFERVAISLGYEQWVPAAQTFYTLSALGKAEALESAVFAAIHKQRVPFRDKMAIAAWGASQGLDSKQFVATFDSFGVKSALSGGERQARSNKVLSTPTLVIDGKYLVPIYEAADFSPQLANVSQLIEQARAERRLSKQK